MTIARAVINEPGLILADELTGNLDRANEEQVLKILQSLHRKGHTVIVVTHNPEVGKIGVQKIYLHHGQIVDKSQVEEGLRTGTIMRGLN